MHRISSKQVVNAILERCEQEWTNSTPGDLDRYVSHLHEEDVRRLALLRLARLVLKRAVRQDIFVGQSRLDATYLLSRYPLLQSPRAAVLDLYGYEFHLRRTKEAMARSQKYGQWPPAPLPQPALSWAQFLESVPANVREELEQPSRYSRLSVLGSGGFGRVWLACDEELGRDVALKELRGTGDEESLRDEARLTGELEHPAIIPIFGLAKTTDGGTSYVMRCVTWETLTARIKRFQAGWSSPDQDKKLRELLRHFITACEAISFAHDRDILHLDIKPSNILVGEYASETMVMDWGLARIAVSQDNVADSAAYGLQPGGGDSLEDGMAEAPTQVEVPIHETPTVCGNDSSSTLDWAQRPENRTHEAAGNVNVPNVMYPSSMVNKLRLGEDFFGGTPGYMSPEQLAGRPGSPADVHALGATLYQVLTGVPPYPTINAHEPVDEYYQRCIAWQVSRPRSKNGHVPRPLDAICMKALAKEPELRYETAHHLAADVENWLADRRVRAYNEPLWEKTWRLVRNNPRVSLIGATSLLLLVVGVLAAIIAIRKAANDATVARAIEALPATETYDTPNAIRALWEEPAAFPMVRRRLNENDQRKEHGDDLRSSPLSSTGELRLRLVMLADDPSQLNVLVDDVERWLNVEPLEVVAWSEIVVEQLPHLPGSKVDELKNVLWNTARGHRIPMQRLKAAIALATLAPQDKRWAPSTAKDDIRPGITLLVAGSDATVLGLWADGLRPVRRQIVPEFLRLCRDGRRNSQMRNHAASILADYLVQDGRLSEMVEALQVATLEQHKILVDRLAGDAPNAVPLILEKMSVMKSGHQFDVQANLAAAVMRLAPGRIDWRLFEPSEFAQLDEKIGDGIEAAQDPRRATKLIHLVPEVNVEAGILLDQLLREESSPAVTRAVILCLGLYPPARLPADAADIVQPYYLHRDPGIRAAAQWWLSRHAPSVIQRLDKLALGAEEPSGQWRLVALPGGNSTMVRITAPAGGKFVMGAPPTELKMFPNFDDEEKPWTRQTRRCMRIEYDFEIASTETTISQLKAFIASARDDAKLAFVNDLHQAWEEGKSYRPTPRSPANNVTWDEACAYCNWLSDREHFEPCYELDGDGHVTAIDTTKNGYRLPNEAEWEWACRAGSRTSRYYGDDPQLLPFYAQHILNSWRHPQPISLSIPNTWGLFDMLGNVFEWCDVAAGDEAPDIEGELLAGARDTRQNYLVRGASFKNNPEVVRSAYRYAFGSRRYIVGFRIARTLQYSQPRHASP